MTSDKKISVRQERAFEVNGRWIDVNFDLRENELTLLLGPNGCGKTTLLTRLKLAPRLLGGRKATYMDQAPLRPLTDMNVEDALNVIAEEVAGAKDWRQLEVVEKLGILAFKDRPISALSGGENQKLKLALSLMKPFDLFIADEPMQNLDENARELFLATFEEMLRAGKTLFIVEHEPEKFSRFNPNAVRFSRSGERVEADDDRV